MKISKFVAKLAGTAAAAAISVSAFAAPSINNLDGTLQPFGGFDWASGAAAWTVGLPAVSTIGDTFQIYYAGWAVALDDTGSGTLLTPRLDTNPNGGKDPGKTYEYTTWQVINASFQGQSGNVISFDILGGSFDIYYDTNANASATTATWTNLKDGTKIVSGTYDASTDNQINIAKTSSIGMTGAVTFTDGGYINPALIGTSIASTLQLVGGTTTNFTQPSSVEGMSINAVTEALFQADANQTFTSSVPEPGSLALAGLALLGVGAARRRNKV